MCSHAPCQQLTQLGVPERVGLMSSWHAAMPHGSLALTPADFTTHPPASLKAKPEATSEAPPLPAPDSLQMHSCPRQPAVARGALQPCSSALAPPQPGKSACLSGLRQAALQCARGPGPGATAIVLTTSSEHCLCVCCCLSQRLGPCPDVGRHPLFKSQGKCLGKGVILRNASWIHTPNSGLKPVTSEENNITTVIQSDTSLLNYLFVLRNTEASTSATFLSSRHSSATTTCLQAPTISAWCICLLCKKLAVQQNRSLHLRRLHSPGFWFCSQTVSFFFCCFKVLFICS